MGLYLNTSALWPKDLLGNTIIPVCWVTPGWDREKRVIQDAVTRTWQKVTRVTFTDWGTKLGTTSNGYVRLSISEATDQQGGGSAGVGQGASVSFALRPTTPLDRIRYLAVHEFGHVLGFQHENDSPQRDPGCSSQQPYGNVTQIGAWDRHSVMNASCNVYGNMIGYLSKGDISSVQSLYGIRGIDNKGDFAKRGNSAWGVWRPSDGTWYIDDNATSPKVWGELGDIPVPGDYDGDGKDEIAVWRPTTGEWFINRLNGALNVTWGQQGDIPVPGDYNGDGTTNCAVWRPSDGTWYIDDNATSPKVWGELGDIPVPGDYDGDGKDEMAVWRPTTGEWFINRLNGVLNVTLGQPGDIPVPGDYLGEGKIRYALFRPNTGEWIFWPGLRPSYFPNQLVLGENGDMPVPGSFFSGNGIIEPAVWRPATGLFIFSSGWSKAWGQSGDIPLPR